LSTPTSTSHPPVAEKFTPNQLVQLGLVAHHQGDLALAQTRYRQCLALNPKHADAMLMLGVVRLAALDFGEAAALIEAACELTGWQSAPYRQNYGLLLSAQIPHVDPVSGAAPAVSVARLSQHITASVDQPLATLKTALRNGAGAALDAAQLAAIAARVRALPRPKDKTGLRGDGFDLVGYAQAESGLGENMRALSRSCVAAHLPISAIDIDAGGESSVSDNALVPLIAPERIFQHQIICVNPDAMAVVAHHQGTAAFLSSYKIGYWFWELERLPALWTHMAGAMQELWAASGFVRTAMASAVSIPVYTVPPSVLPPTPSRHYARSEFGLQDEDFVFLFTFSYWSAIARKNPWAVVQAFREAFPLSVARAKLVIKTVNSDKFAPDSAALHALAASDPRIVFIDQVMTRDQLSGLQHACDCYVSLHRSEGFGLGMAEFMALGKPVIATAYSANLDYMNEGNSLLVDYALIAVKAGEYPDAQDQVWADANVDSAARHMRRVFDDASLRHTLGDAAKQFMHAHYSPAAVGAQLRTHLDRLNASGNF
jgi:glycosyltransferase involved in cell wall biosynthesis